MSDFIYAVNANKAANTDPHEQLFYLDDPLIPASEYVGPSAPWVAGRLYSFVPHEPLCPTLFAQTAFKGNKYNFYCIIWGAYTGIIINSQQATLFVQGYSNSFMIKVKSQSEALKIYNDSLKAKQVKVVRRSLYVAR